MRIAYYCNEYPPRPHGGIGTYVQALARGVTALGHPATVVEFGEAFRERLDAGVRVVTLPTSSVRGLSWLLNRRRLRHWLEREAAAAKLDIVETPEFEGMLPFGLTNCPSIIRLHTSATTIANNAGRRSPAALRWCERQTLLRNGTWASCAKHAFDLARDTFGIRTPQPIISDLPLDLGVHEEPPPLPNRFVLFAGTVSERKGALRLAAAARILLARHPDVSLVYAGQELQDSEGNPLGVSIRRTIGDASRDRVHLLGRLSRSQVLSAMARASAFTLPSSLEVSPLVIAEAMLCGCPVVVPPGAPFNEMVANGETGLAVDVSDPGAFAAVLERLLSDPVLAANLSQRALDAARARFAPTRVAEQALTLYRQRVSAFRTRAPEENAA